MLASDASVSGADPGDDQLRCVSPYAALAKFALSQPHADAIVTDYARISHAQIFERVNHCAVWLTLNGIIPGEVTGICIRDEISHLICALALLCMGSPQISLGAHETDQTKRQLALRVGATQLIVEKTEAWMAGLRTVVSLREIALKPDTAETGLFRPSSLADVAVYLSTSGTTSLPKTFDLSYGRLTATTKRYMTDPKEKRSLRLGSVEFDAIRLNRICSILAGNVCVGLHQHVLDSVVSVCERELVSVLRVGPHQLASLLRSSNAGGRLPSDTQVLVSGARVCGALRNQAKAISNNLWVQYSTSETGLVSTAAPDEHDNFPEGIGFPENGVTVEIVGSEDESLPLGEVGHARIRKDTMASGYIGEPDATSRYRAGWFVPGDLLSREREGPLVFHGRADDVMILDGINIFPSAIEDVLESIQGVQEAVAFPIKSRIHGEIPIAAVVLSNAVEVGDVAPMLRYCQQMLGVRAPRQIRVVKSIPRNAVGKPLRRELAAL